MFLISDHIGMTWRYKSKPPTQTSISKICSIHSFFCKKVKLLLTFVPVLINLSFNTAPPHDMIFGGENAVPFRFPKANTASRHGRTQANA
jgi:hypothetical protein